MCCHRDRERESERTATVLYIIAAIVGAGVAPVAVHYQLNDKVNLPGIVGVLQTEVCLYRYCQILTEVTGHFSYRVDLSCTLITILLIIIIIIIYTVEVIGGLQSPLQTLPLQRDEYLQKA